MDSSNEHIQLISSTNESYDSDHSADSNRSMEQPPAVDNRDPPDESVIEFFTSAFDGNISELRELVNRLREITESVEKFHRNATVGSLSGSVIGAAGGITTIVGLVLTPFTLGASLIVTGVGIGVAAAGGITGAASNITNMIKKKTSREEIETILNTFQNRISPIIKYLEEIESMLDEDQKDDPTDPSTRKAHIGLGAILGILSSLFLVLDVVFIVKDAKELYDIDNDPKDGNGKSAISKFIKVMNDTVDHHTETLDQLQQVRNLFNAKTSKR